MLKRLSTTSLAVAMAASLATGPLARPAQASTGSTWTLITAGAALIGGIILYNNYEHKRQAANSIVGYTRNGGTVYGDGRIVMPDGATIYPGRNGRYPWGQSAYYQPGATGYAYDYQRTGQYDRTRRHSYYRGDADDQGDRDDYARTRYRVQVKHNHARAHHKDRDRDRD